MRNQIKATVVADITEYAAGSIDLASDPNAARVERITSYFMGLGLADATAAEIRLTVGDGEAYHLFDFLTYTEENAE